jgi:cytoskeletal protein RodZ
VEEDCGGSVSETRSSTSDSSATSESASESESEAAPAAGKRARTGTDTPPEWRTAATHILARLQVHAEVQGRGASRLGGDLLQTRARQAVSPNCNLP